MKRTKENYYLVKKILEDWNPFYFEKDLAKIEYESYISDVFNFDFSSLCALKKSIVNFVQNDLDLHHDENDFQHKIDVDSIAFKLYSLANEDELKI